MFTRMTGQSANMPSKRQRQTWIKPSRTTGSVVARRKTGGAICTPNANGVGRRTISGGTEKNIAGRLNRIGITIITNRARLRGLSLGLVPDGPFASLLSLPEIPIVLSLLLSSCPTLIRFTVHAVGFGGGDSVSSVARRDFYRTAESAVRSFPGRSEFVPLRNSQNDGRREARPSVRQQTARRSQQC